MTSVLVLSVLLTAGIAQATLYTPPMDWPNSMTDTRNPLTDAQDGTWSAYTQTRGAANNGTYNLSVAGDRAGVANWIAATGQWPSIRTSSTSTSVEFCIFGANFTPSDGWGVLSFQPAVGGSDVSITGQLAVTSDWRTSYPLSITAEIIKLNAAGDVAEVIGSITGLRKSTAAWSFDLTTTMLATDTIRIRMIDMEPSGSANGRVVLSNYQIDVTPEPATMSLLAVGGLGILLRRKA